MTRITPPLPPLVRQWPPDIQRRFAAEVWATVAATAAVEAREAGRTAEARRAEQECKQWMRRKMELERGLSS